MKLNPALRGALIVAAALAANVAVINQVKHLPRIKASEQLAVAVPAPAQALLAGGDRFLAANLATVRAMVVSTQQLDAASYRILGLIQRDAAMLNPAHEDNYYTAQAVLPWNGELLAGNDIVIRATHARPWDYSPPFFYGFNQYYFAHDAVGGAEGLKIAAARSEEGNRAALTAMAARWYERGAEPKVAMAMIDALVIGTRNRDLKAHLLARKARIETLEKLQVAAAAFRSAKGRNPASFDELVSAGLISGIPEDPLGEGFTLDKSGTPIVEQRVDASKP
jgi:hypothetical protein